MISSCRAATSIMTAAILMAVAAPVVAQQAYPAKPIRFILPYAPGGSTSVIARIVGQKLTEIEQ